MPLVKRDPLLTAARWIVNFIMAVMAFAASLLLIAIPILLFNQGKVVAEIVAEHPEAAGSSLIGPIIVLMLVVIALFCLAITWLVNLRRIIGSVAQGDPFIPVNADRLARMGWITLTMQLAAFPATAVAGWIQTQIDNLQLDFEFSLTGLLLALLLFILARVFRHGTALRDDLEGTV
ncbi:hypothetical protein GCM10023115_01680 [Pontixanthobacter gangjinensis]|uniref:DUF2975 domain-containing protein n=1 Tax=Pontixanthobacter gangjinensis TaxID=1028742 RepID=A0A6I4SII5_9SPHN|nr:DUF2975 domain-containing protein [Pontixanthobacter gangjinensis]MXO55423.1 DUF2975 domain-containing protein [Pontixanthobacter gangjinensis]